MQFNYYEKAHYGVIFQPINSLHIAEINDRTPIFTMNNSQNIIIEADMLTKGRWNWMCYIEREKKNQLENGV